LRGVVCLHDSGTGELLAVLDSATVPAWRTGLAAALGTHVLARHDACSVTVIGAGAQSGLVMRGLAALRSWERLTVCDLDAERAGLFASHHAIATAVSPANSRDAARDADIVVLATWSARPCWTTVTWRRARTSPRWEPTSPARRNLARRCGRPAGSSSMMSPLALTAGALGTAALSARDTAGTLGQVLQGTVPGRRTDADLTVYTPVGLPWQDLALAWAAYRDALTAGIGGEFDFLA
jgi:alanine dehydrogenase